MSKYLLKTTEVFRVDSESEAELLIEETKADSSFELTDYSVKKKTTKDDEYFLVTFKKKFNDEKNPI